MKFKVLIIDDEKELCASLADVLNSHGFEALTTTDPYGVFTLLDKYAIDLMIMDMKMPKISGLELLRSVKGRKGDIPVIMMTGYPNIENAVEAMRNGALNFYVKPLKIKDLIQDIRQLEGARHHENPQGGEDEMVTQNEALLQIQEEIAKVAPTNVPVLITGESGTGKELIATALHKQRQRGQGPFVKVNCASIPDNLLESELFGHEKGAFTDAVKTRAGKFEVANGGTIFLDEIGEMNVKTQPKLLRVLQNGEIQRVGSDASIRTNVRVVAATNRDVYELMQNMTFREDLFYRLSVVTFHLPPLRERKDDIFPLAHYFVRNFCQIYNKNITGLSDEVKGLFLQHNWPGNIRELKNCVERSIIFSEPDDEELQAKYLPAQYRKKAPSVSKGESLNELYQHLSREKILEALAKHNGVKQKAADELNIHRKTLYNRMKKLEME